MSTKVKKTQLGNNYSVVSIKRTECNKRTGWSKFFFSTWKKEQSGAKFFLVHEKKVQGGKKLQNS